MQLGAVAAALSAAALTTTTATAATTAAVRQQGDPPLHHKRDWHLTRALVLAAHDSCMRMKRIQKRKRVGYA